MSLNSPLKLTLPALSLTLLITSCASTSNLNPDNSDNSENNDYWYCAPGDQRTWRCAEEKESLGLSYYRFWKTTLDPEAENLEAEQSQSKESESEESEQTADGPIMVQGAKVSVVEEVSAEFADEIKEEAVDTPEEPLSQQRLKQPAAEPKPTYVQNGKYGKVLQLAAYYSQSQARSFADSLNDTLSQKPNLIRTRVNGQTYYTVVFDQLSSQQEAEQLIAELAESFPTIQPWLRSRSGFEALRAD